MTRSLGLLAVLSSLGLGLVVRPADASWNEIGGLPEQGQWRNGFDLADLNGDGRVDLAHGPARRELGAPKFFLGRETGGFAPWSSASYPELDFDYGDAAAADFNGDGRQDVAIAMHLRGLALLAGDGLGRFRVLADFLGAPGSGSAFSSRAIAAGDLDGDGRPDLAVIGEGPRPRSPGRSGSYGVRVLLNRLPGPWHWVELHPAAGRLFGDGIALADFDGDGRTDLATASSVQGQRGILFWADADSWTPGVLEALPADGYVQAVAAGDVDADGDADLAVATAVSNGARVEGAVTLLLSNGDRSWRAIDLAWPMRDDQPTALGWGDPDGDGDADLVALTAAGALAFFVNHGSSLAAGEKLGAELGGRGCRGYHVQLADLDRDGRDEVVASFADENCAGGGSLRAWRWSGRSEQPSPP